MRPLESIIRDEIRARGPMRFERFMELALYHPEHGYYASPPKIGRAGDFFTSVSVGPLFGQLLARQARQMAVLLDEPAFWIIEQGANDGQLAHDILTECRGMPDFFGQLRYLIVEPSRAAREVQQRVLGELGARVEWLNQLDEWKNEKPAGVFISNELIDAFPVQSIECKDGAWLEHGVSVDDADALTWTLLPIRDAELQDAIAGLPLPLIEGYRTEINLAARRWMRDVAAFLRRGYVVTIDYGYPASEYYAPFRNAGTLTCFYQHRRGDDVLRTPGEQDITAHVDFTALVHVGEKAGWQTLALIDQQRFFTGIAHDELAGTTVHANGIQSQTRAWQMLTHPEHLGVRFHALLQAKDAPVTLDGLRFARRGGLD